MTSSSRWLLRASRFSLTMSPRAGTSRTGCAATSPPSSPFPAPVAASRTATAACERAENGIRGTTRSQALAALAFLTEREFAGLAPMEPQLARVHLNADAPVATEDVDELMLARFALRRGTWSWTRLLSESGLFPTNIALDYLRSRRGLKWALPASLILAPAYWGAGYAVTTLVENGGPGWLNLAVRTLRVERHQVRHARPLDPGPSTLPQHSATPPKSSSGGLPLHDNPDPLLRCSSRAAASAAPASHGCPMAASTVSADQDGDRVKWALGQCRADA